MPFLRFTRDQRGYENTFLMHTFRRRGRGRQRILYWFRTPPNVRVGRAPLDEEAIRTIEESNSELSFDWTKILEAQPKTPVEPAPAKPRRGRRGATAPLEEAADVAGGELPVPVNESIEEASELEEAALDVEGETAIETPSTRGSVEELLGTENLARLRARCAELQARITERGGDPARQEALRQQAESLNPETWVTPDEIQQGLAEFETRFEAIRRTLGGRRRRRGGLRRTRRRKAAAARRVAAPVTADQPPDSEDQ